MMQAGWYEWNGPKPSGLELMTLHRLLQEKPITTWHWFFDEPWSPWVVRVCLSQPTGLGPLGNYGEWRDVRIELGGEFFDQFGEYVRLVFSLLNVTSELMLTRALGEPPIGHRGGVLSARCGTSLYPRKLIHCVMNTFGYEYLDEAALYREMAESAETLAELEAENNTEAANAYAATLPQRAVRRGLFKW